MKLTTLKPRLQVMRTDKAIAVEINPSSWRGDKKTSSQRGYDYRWQKARSAYLDKHPMCVYCERKGEHTGATVVDHRIPHRGDMRLFWDSSNWMSLCTHCHSSIKQREENRTGS